MFLVFGLAFASQQCGGIAAEVVDGGGAAGGSVADSGTAPSSAIAPGASSADIACAGREAGAPCCPGSPSPNDCANNAPWFCSDRGACVLTTGAEPATAGADDAAAGQATSPGACWTAAPGANPVCGPEAGIVSDPGLAHLGGFCVSPSPGDGGDASDLPRPDAGSAIYLDAGAIGSLFGDGAPTCGCTRRPGPGASFQCPRGVGEETTAVIGPAGGRISLQGRQAHASGVAAFIDLPPTALAAPTAITLTETAIPPPDDLLDWSPVYRIAPLGLALSSPAAIQFPWGGLSGLVPRLSIWFSPDGACFSPVADSYTNAGFEQGSTSQLGFFVVGAPRMPATPSCP